MSVSQAPQAVSAIVTATRLNNYPQGVLTVAPLTSDASATSSTTELDVLTASAVTLNASNRRIKISWHCRAIAATVTGGTDIFTVRIKEGATTLAESAFSPVVTAGAATGGCDFFALLDSPTAAAHTYKVTIQRAVGSGTATVKASATGPALLVVEDVGVSP
jgi:hypothetical protein